MSQSFYQVTIFNRGCISTFSCYCSNLFYCFLRSITLLHYSFSHIKCLVPFKKCFYSKIHSSCFLTFKCLIRLIVFSASLFLSIPFEILWYFQIVIYLNNDISIKPGPYFQNIFLNFMSWNLNSLAKDNFQRVSLIEAHNSLSNYDLISIYETSLNDSVGLLLNEYTFVPNPTNTKYGGVGLFYKNSLPVGVRTDLCFHESIVIELFCIEALLLITTLSRHKRRVQNQKQPHFQDAREIITLTTGYFPVAMEKLP